MEITVSKQINAPIEVTFGVVSDIEKAPEHISGIKRVEILSDVKQGLGTRWRETRLVFGREATEEMEISSFQPNRSYEAVSESRGTNYHTRFTFTEKAGGTLVEMTFSSTPTTLITRLMALFEGLLAGSIRKMLETDLDELKVAAERQAATT
jgi:uncharacterized membrane protein